MTDTDKVKWIFNFYFNRRHFVYFMGVSVVYTFSVYFLGALRTETGVGLLEKTHTEAITGSLVATGFYAQSSLTKETPVSKETSTPQTTPEPFLYPDIRFNPPTLDVDLWSEILKAEEVDLTLLSNLIQNQIRDVQSNCSGVTLKCGHGNPGCGFGCQVHQRVACLMISYLLSVPLIHDETTGWIFTQKWSDLFLPLGSNCSEGPQTIRWMWDENNAYENPLHNGIPVTKELADFLNKNLELPFQWLMGQFIKYSLKLTAEIERDIKRDMVAISFQRPIIGIHVRRTDKAGEAGLQTHHEIPEYMTWAEEAYKTLGNNSALPPKRTVFIASDDAATVVLEAQQKYAHWTVLGFPSQQTLASAACRKGAAYDILRDIFILSECDFVVCGFSSNVCTMVLEMLSFKHGDMNLVKGLDGEFAYYLHNKSFPSQMVGISGNDTVIWKRRTQ